MSGGLGVVEAVRPLFPLEVDVGYASERSRLSTLFRLPLAVPVLLFSFLLNVGAALATWAAIVARGYPVRQGKRSAMKAFLRI
jgi:hypothetical protein